MSEPDGVPIEIETSAKDKDNKDRSSKNPNAPYMNYLSFIPPISKSLWTSAVENTMNYARIVWDLFSEERLLRFVVNDGQNVVQLNNTWGTETQNTNFVSEGFANVGLPIKPVNSLQLGIQSAVETLSFVTEAQSAAMLQRKSKVSKNL